MLKCLCENKSSFIGKSIYTFIGVAFFILILEELAATPVDSSLLKEVSNSTLKNMKCESCKKVEGQFNICAGDGRAHHHGAVHTIDEGLKWLCKNCAEIEAEKWDRNRKKGK